MPSSAPAIELTCSSGTAGYSPEGTKLHGAATNFFGWRSGRWQQADLQNVPKIVLGGQSFYQIKSPIFVFEKASATVRITLLKPANARLYYTDWATWSRLGNEDESAQAREIIAASSSAVSVPRYGEDGWGVTGMLLQESGTCLTFQVTGKHPDWHITRTVPFGKDRC